MAYLNKPMAVPAEKILVGHYNFAQILWTSKDEI